MLNELLPIFFTLFAFLAFQTYFSVRLAGGKFPQKGAIGHMWQSQLTP